MWSGVAVYSIFVENIGFGRDFLGKIQRFGERPMIFSVNIIKLKVKNVQETRSRIAGVWMFLNSYESTLFSAELLNVTLYFRR